MERKKDRVISFGQMVLPTTGSLETIIFMVKVITNGLMEESTKAHGRVTRCMDMVCFFGLMEGVTKENTMRTKSMDKEPSSGPMEESTLVDGLLGHKTERDIMWEAMVKTGKVSGKMEKELNGMMEIREAAQVTARSEMKERV